MLIQSDAFNLPYKSKTFHACVTSPPYWGLRKYSGDQGEEPLGLEATPERHIERMVEVFREVRRVLRDDGVVWLNYADCFIDGQLALMPHRLAIALQADGWIVRNDLVWFKRNPMPESVAGWRWERKRTKNASGKYESDEKQGHTRTSAGFNQRWDGEDGWSAEYEYGDDYVLRKSSWRHTRSHEYVFMLVKKPKYYCNQEVVREIVAGPSTEHNKKYPRYSTGDGKSLDREGKPDYLNVGNDRGQAGRNPRSVLDVPTAPYKGAHYATFPPKLIAPLIRASVPRRCCPECGMAWAPVVESRGYSKHRPSAGDDPRSRSEDKQALGSLGGKHGWQGNNLLKNTPTVTDYRPTCECNTYTNDVDKSNTYIDGVDNVPGIVLDIFGGSGTTGMVAKELLRRWVVMDISRPYLDEQAKVRTGSGTPSKALEGLPMFGGEDETE